MSITEEVDDARLRGAEVLRTLKRYRGISDGDLATLLGMSRQKVQTYMAGTTRLEIGLMAAFARALNVEPEVWFMEPDDALIWTVTHRPNMDPKRRRRSSGQEFQTSGWFTEDEQQLTAA